MKRAPIPTTEPVNVLAGIPWKLPTPRRATKRLHQSRQPGSLKIWWNEKDNSVWASVDVHYGRVTRRIRGREAPDMEAAIDALTEYLNA